MNAVSFFVVIAYAIMKFSLWLDSFTTYRAPFCEMHTHYQTFGV